MNDRREPPSADPQATPGRTDAGGPSALPPGEWAIRDGRLLTWALEAQVTDHCNLRCEACCTLSPHLAPRFTDPAALERDLRRAARAVAPSVFKLTGGEPLLHPDLVACVQAARRSGIAPVVSMTTNGLLARRAPDALWRALDRVTVSFYTSAPLPERTIAHIEDRCARHGVLLTWKPTAGFQRMGPPAPHDADGARRVWETCWLRVRCHMVHEGRFHPCTRPPHLADVHGVPLAAGDGVPLDSPTLLDDVLAVLARPLEACALCLGASGERIPHAQLPRSTRKGSGLLPRAGSDPTTAA